MILNGWAEEKYSEYLEDIEIAQKEIKDIKLYPTDNILCDLYALPSPNFQSYYAMIHECAGKFEMAYAKPQIDTVTSPEPIKTCRFSTCRETEIHTGFHGRIVIGIKSLSEEFIDLIKDMIDAIPNQYILEKNYVIIDGEIQGIRAYDGNQVVKKILYSDAERMSLSSEKEDMANKLNNLYRTIGEMIDYTEK